MSNFLYWLVRFIPEKSFKLAKGLGISVLEILKRNEDILSDSTSKVLFKYILTLKSCTMNVPCLLSYT